MTKGMLIRRWIGYLILVSGVCVLASPFVTGYLDGRQQKQAVSEYVDTFIRQPEEDLSSAEPEETKVPSQTSAARKGDYGNTSAFYQAALHYNRDIYENGQSRLTSRSSTEYFPLRAGDYGYQKGTIGTIWIPRMNVELGLYLGANTENMAKGAAIFGETSVPLGLKNENASIAGHRGWRGTSMFRDIQALQMGDAIYITTGWGTLLYRVCDIAIVSPDDKSWCMIRENESLITLMTCHPYTENYQRYIVFARLTQMLDKDYLLNERNRLKAEKETLEAADDSIKIVKEYAPDGSVRDIEIDAKVITPGAGEYGAVWSNVMILAEKQIFRITQILILLVVLLGIWVVISTVKYKRSRRNQNEKSSGINQSCNR